MGIDTRHVSNSVHEMGVVLVVCLKIWVLTLGCNAVLIDTADSANDEC